MPAHLCSICIRIVDSVCFERVSQELTCAAFCIKIVYSVCFKRVSQELVARHAPWMCVGAGICPNALTTFTTWSSRRMRLVIQPRLPLACTQVCMQACILHEDFASVHAKSKAHPAVQQVAAAALMCDNPQSCLRSFDFSAHGQAWEEDVKKQANLRVAMVQSTIKLCLHDCRRG